MSPDCYHPRCGSPTRTGDLQVMSLTSYQLLYPAMFFFCSCKDSASRMQKTMFCAEAKPVLAYALSENAVQRYD